MHAHVKRGQVGQAAQGVPVLPFQPVRARVFVRVVQAAAPGQEKEPLRLSVVPRQKVVLDMRWPNVKKLSVGVPLSKTKAVKVFALFCV